MAHVIRIINFECFVVSLDSYVASFKLWWSIENELFGQGIEGMRTSTSEKEISIKITEQIKNLFCAW